MILTMTTNMMNWMFFVSFQEVVVAVVVAKEDLVVKLKDMVEVEVVEVVVVEVVVFYLFYLVLHV